MEEEAKTRENGKGYEGEAVVKKKKKLQSKADVVYSGNCKWS
jgi:hypothetical protein